MARIYAKCYKREVLPNRIPREEWVQTLINAGFSTDAATNMVAMTATHKHHLGFYPGEEPIVVFKKRLADYKTSKGAVQFPWNKPFSKELVRDMLLWQAEDI